MAETPQFAFLVHPLNGFQRRVVGVRRAHLGAALGFRATAPDPGLICQLEAPELAQGRVVSVPLLPQEMMEDQEFALEQMVLAVEAAGPVAAVGLGSLLAVVAGRGEALAQRVGVPVTTGAAATAWAAARNTVSVARARGLERVAVLGFGGVVGEGVARLLVEEGLDVVAAGRGRGPLRRAEALGIGLLSEEEAVQGCKLVVGAATTGGTLRPDLLEEDTVLLDVALPSTLAPGTRPRGVLVLAGEALALPEGWLRGFWGCLYHILSGYGPTQIYACLAEPMVMAATGRTEPFSLGRHLEKEDLNDFARAAEELGLVPRLAQGWKEVVLVD